jgi:hypothetical protein
LKVRRALMRKNSARTNSWLLVPVLCCVAFLSGSAQVQSTAQVDIATLPQGPKTKVDFRRDIAPIFKERCLSCHSSERQSGGLRLDNRGAALAGGNSGTVIKIGDSAGSKLIHLVAGLKKGMVMPMTGEPLTSEQVGLLRAWIDQGAEWPEEPQHAGRGGKTEQLQPKTTHWAFIRPESPPLPRVRNQAWVNNPIDAFVLAKLEAEGIEPSPEADRATLIRRLSLDLVGLPPNPEEVAQFLSDNRSDAYERLVEHLLDSPHYGEKWARQWLDLARYADSDGYETDAPRPHAWRYRQWVIDALNRNMPFDQFTIEQLAGDLLPNATLDQKVATGFNRNTLSNREGGLDMEMLRLEQVADRTSTLGTVWLGLTLGCAVCHNHKYDPISQKEYYQLSVFFDSAVEVDIEAPLAGEIGPYLHGKPEYDKKRRDLLAEYNVPNLQAEWEKKTLEVATNPAVGEQWVLAWEYLELFFPGGRDVLRLSGLQRTQKQQYRLTDHFLEWYGLIVGEENYKQIKFQELRDKLERLAAEYPALSEAQTIAENPRPPTTHLLIRGDFRQPGIEVQPATPAVLHPMPATPRPSRLTLARWLVSEENPLTARVMVNRMWQELFGRGLVESSENFGTRGDTPSHPELLDWLATEFVSGRWNMKRIQKLIVESATYRQSSKTRKDLQARDPYNRLLARQSRFRLPAELVRDVTLAASGLIDPDIGGKSVYPPQPASVGALAYQNQWKESKGRDRYRRGLYVYFKRTGPYPQLMTFDAPDSLTTCSRRVNSTTPLQALNLLNDPVFFEAAQALAARVLRERKGSVRDRIDYAFRLCLGHDPTQRDEDRMVSYYQQQKGSLAQNPKSVEMLFPAEGVEGIEPLEAAAWVGMSSILLNLDEFVTRE